MPPLILLTALVAIAEVAAAVVPDAVSIHNQALKQLHSGRFDEAAYSLQQLLSSTLPPQARVQVLSDMGIVRRMQGRYDEAQQYYCAALDVAGKELGTSHPYYATVLNNLGQLAYTRRDWAA